MSNEQEYLNLCKKVLAEGNKKGDRTGTGTLSIFGHQMRFDLQEGFPLLTTKKVPFRLIASELIWFLKGDTNIKFLLQHNNNIWNEWAFKKWIESDNYKGPDMTDFGRRATIDEEFKKVYDEQMEIFKEKILSDEDFAKRYGDLGNVYGKQWRDWKKSSSESVDQITDVINDIKNKPDSRRLLVSAWNPTEINSMALPPCHTLFQFYVADGKLSCQLYQRSGDIFLGIPFNIASYALLTHLIAYECNLEVGEFIHTIGDAHIYSNHMEQINEQLTRTPNELPKIEINQDLNSIFETTMEDIKIIGYNPHSSIKAPVAV